MTRNDAPERNLAGPAASPREVPRLDTARFYLRSLRPSDAGTRWVAWLADPEVMHPVNTAAKMITLERLRAYITKQNPSKRLLVGIFDRANDRHIGYYKIGLSLKNRVAFIDLIIGEKDYWGRRVVLETRASLLDYLFDEAKLAKAVVMPLARNFSAIFNCHAQGWRLEGIMQDHHESIVAPGRRCDVLQFGLTREEWVGLRG